MGPPSSLRGPPDVNVLIVDDHDGVREVTMELVVPDAGRVGPLPRATTGRGRVARKGELRMATILLIILVLLLIGALPTWPYSSGWGYYPSGGLGLVLLVILILALTGRL
jgi:hypothetical protein